MHEAAEVAETLEGARARAALSEAALRASQAELAKVTGELATAHGVLIQCQSELVEKSERIRVLEAERDALREQLALGGVVVRTDSPASTFAELERLANEARETANKNARIADARRVCWKRAEARAEAAESRLKVMEGALCRVHNFYLSRKLAEDEEALADAVAVALAATPAVQETPPGDAKTHEGHLTAKGVRGTSPGVALVLSAVQETPPPLKRTRLSLSIREAVRRGDEKAVFDFVVAGDALVDGALAAQLRAEAERDEARAEAAKLRADNESFDSDAEASLRREAQARLEKVAHLMSRIQTDATAALSPSKAPPTAEDRLVLWLHLLSEHAGFWNEASRLEDLLASHADEHKGPGTIRNHDPASRAYDFAKVARVLTETAEDYNPATPKPGSGGERNEGHGHVRPRPDGMKARCGGPSLCSVCQREKAALGSGGEGGR